MNHYSPLKTPLRASKWLEVQLLVDDKEMNELFSALGSFGVYRIGCICKTDLFEISRADFLNSYSNYLQHLKEGKVPQEATFRPYFSAVLSVSPECLYVQELQSGKGILHLVRPAVQMQVHRLGFSSVDGKFRPMVFGKESIEWGIQFSYPQMMEDPLTGEPVTVVDADHFPNTALFRRLQKWVREKTVPTPFLVNEARINVPMRLGKCCFDWINRHPQLLAKSISVAI